MAPSRRLNTDDYAIGWICALPIELAAATVMLDEEHEIPDDFPRDNSDTNLYTLGRIGAHNVVISCLPAGQTGKSSAAAVAMQLRSKFTSFQFGLMVGIGGGVPSAEADIRLGDVVISQPTGQFGGVVQYDFGKMEAGGFRRTGSLNTPPSILLSAVSKLRSNQYQGKSSLSPYLTVFERLPDAQFSRELAGPDDREKECAPRSSPTVMCHYGTVASGNTVVKNREERDHWSKLLGGVLCFEMEAAGLMNSFPCLIVRGICDYADERKHKAWQPFAAATAAACAKELLSLVPEIVVSNHSKQTKEGGIVHTKGEMSSEGPNVSFYGSVYTGGGKAIVGNQFNSGGGSMSF